MPGNVLQIEKLPTIQRLPAYLHVLKGMQADGQEFVSATQLAEHLQLQPIVSRKDMSVTGIVGRPRIGYPVEELIRFIEEFLGWNNTTEAFLVGCGHLGSALLGYQGFSEYGLKIVAAFDLDNHKVGTVIHDKPVFHLDKLANLADRMRIHLGILAVPSDQAQAVADAMVEAGIQGIWNFTPVQLTVPEQVITQNQDLATGLAVLSSQLKRSLDNEAVTDLDK